MNLLNLNHSGRTAYCCKICFHLYSSLKQQRFVHECISKIQTLLMAQAWSLILWWRNICILSVSFKHLKNLQELFYPITSHAQSMTIQKVCTCLTLYSWSSPSESSKDCFFWLLNLKFHLKGKTVLLSARWITIIVLSEISLT